MHIDKANAKSAIYFPREEYVDRWQKIALEMQLRGHETLVVWQRSAGSFDRAGDVFWLTNYASSMSGQEHPVEPFAVGMGFAAVLFLPGREPELHIAELAEGTDTSRFVCGAIFEHMNLFAGLAARMRVLGIEGRVAYVGDDTLPAMYDRILRRESPQIEWVPDDHFMFEPQSIKSPRELDAFRIAGEISTRSLTAAMEAMIAGETESEAAARAAAIVLRAGGGLHRVALHHGEKSEINYWSDPFYGFNTQAPKPGDMVRGWIYGPIFQGYWLDPGRSAVCGNRPTPAQKTLIEGAVGIVEGIMGEVKPGVTPRQLGTIGEELTRKFGGYDQKQLPLGNYGHGIGGFFIPHCIPAGESVAVADTDGSLRYDKPLRPGMVHSVEAFLTHTGVGSATFEQLFIITDTGIELLTKTPMVFW